MSDSTGGFDPEHAVDPASIARAEELKARFGKWAEGTPQHRYLVATRKMPAEAVRRCSGDLAVLDPPIPHFPAHAYGIVSIIRSPDGEELGFSLEACGPAGEAVKRDGKTLRRFFNLSGKRFSGGLFGAAVAVHRTGCSLALLCPSLCPEYRHGSRERLS